MSGPSKASLREIPPIPDEEAIEFGRGPEGLKKMLAWARQERRGRPKKGEQAAGTTVKSLKLPDEVWAALERKARQRGITLHALLREAVAKLLAA